MSSIRGLVFKHFETSTGVVRRLAAASLVGLLLSPAALADEMPAGDMAMPSDQEVGMKAHANLALAKAYPSATECGDCHPQHYREWSISQHAYAQMSPIFNTMQGAINVLTNGTNGDFCIRCHNQVGMNLGEPNYASNIDRHPTSREGISCIVCHRLNEELGKISGRFHLVAGGITDAIYGPVGNNTELDAAIASGGLVTDPDKAGRKVHAKLDAMPYLNRSAFCGSCHDVLQPSGFRLEDAFSEWKNSPAAKADISCQDCHMGVEQGAIAVDRDDPDFTRKNYAFGPAAVVGSRGTAPRKLTNHRFLGPDHSIVSPALFPLNILAVKEEYEKDDPTARGMATIREWLLFDWEAGWGSDEFEDEDPDPDQFPERWESPDDRYDARELIEENLALLAEQRVLQLELYRNGYVLGDTRVTKASDSGLKFEIQVKSNTTGHGVPTGFDGERMLWLFVQVMDANGKVIFESGDLDPNGDVRDLHSVYVHNHERPLDTQLFSLQSRFLTTQVRGPEKERVIAVPLSPNALRFGQPSFRSAMLLGRPAGARKHRFGIEPNGHRWAKYKVKKGLLTQGPYTAKIQLKGGMVPVNLIHEIGFLGFDYDLSEREIARRVVDGHQIIWERTIELQ